MSKPVSLAAIFLFSISFLSAQQETYLTHFAFNKVLYNPAYAGYGSQFCLNSFHHRQWISLKDYTGRFRTTGGLAESPAFPSRIAPTTQGFGLSVPIIRKKYATKLNLGGLYLGFIDDIIAYEKNTSLKAGISFAIHFDDDNELRLGIDANYLTKSFNVAMLRAMDANDPKIPIGNNPSDSKILLGSGVFYTSTWNNFFAGLSISSLNRADFQYANISGTTHIQSARHAYFVAGMASSKGNWKKQSMMLLKSANDGLGWIRPQLDLQYHGIYQNFLSIGSGVRAQVTGMDAFSLLLGFYPGTIWPALQPRGGNFRIGYSYDVTLQSLRLSSRNTHEIQINYCFSLPERDIRHPRDMMHHEKARYSPPKKWWF